MSFSPGERACGAAELDLKLGRDYGLCGSS